MAVIRDAHFGPELVDSVWDDATRDLHRMSTRDLQKRYADLTARAMKEPLPDDLRAQRAALVAELGVRHTVAQRIDTPRPYDHAKAASGPWENHPGRSNRDSVGIEVAWPDPDYRTVTVPLHMRVRVTDTGVHFSTQVGDGPTASIYLSDEDIGDGASLAEAAEARTKTIVDHAIEERLSSKALDGLGQTRPSADAPTGQARTPDGTDT